MHIQFFTLEVILSGIFSTYLEKNSRGAGKCLLVSLVRRWIYCASYRQKSPVGFSRSVVTYLPVISGIESMLCRNIYLYRQLRRGAWRRVAAPALKLATLLYWGAGPLR